MKLKLYQSRGWLWQKYVAERLTQEDIAELAGTSQVTINRYIKKFDLKRKG